jgi:exopolysaccharide biosynthesis WecB/TagA/CpsF family protein
MSAPFPTREILGVKIALCRRDEAIAHLLERVALRQPTKVAFANSNLLMQLDDDHRATLLDSFLVFNDGLALDLASKLIYGAPFPDNVNGSDLTPELIAAAPKGTRLFLYGARPGVARQAGAVLAARYGVEICGALDGFKGAGSEAATVKTIREARPDIVLVALGNPRQERWMAEVARELDAPLIMGIGALLDYLTGTVQRAPAPIQRLRLEWLWRLGLEPKRLGKRYTIDLARFLWRARKEGRARQRAA